MNNWIVGNLQASFDTWNEKLTEIWSLVTTTPQAFRGGEIWNTIVTINDGLKAFGYGLLVLFFAMSVFRSAASFRDLQRPEFALRHFIRFIIAKVAVGSAMEIMTAVFSVCGGVVQSIMGCIGGMSAASVTLPQEIADAIEEVGFFQSVPLWMVTFLGSLFITVLSFGFKYGIPNDADLVFDVRFLPNPYYVEALRSHTGQEAEVQAYVRQGGTADRFLSMLYGMLDFLIPNYVQEGKNQLVIAIGCTGGRHRSVTVANALYQHLSGLEEYGLKIEHRDIGR